MMRYFVQGFIIAVVALVIVGIAKGDGAPAINLHMEPGVTCYVENTYDVYCRPAGTPRPR